MDCPDCGAHVPIRIPAPHPLRRLQSIRRRYLIARMPPEEFREWQHQLGVQKEADERQLGTAIREFLAGCEVDCAATHPGLPHWEYEFLQQGSQG